MGVTRRDALVGAGAFGAGAVLVALVGGGSGGRVAPLDEPGILDDRPTIRVRSGSIVVEIDRGTFRKVGAPNNGRQRWAVTGQGPDAFTVRGPGFKQDRIVSGGVRFTKAGNPDQTQIVSFGFDTTGNARRPFVELTAEAELETVKGNKRLELKQDDWELTGVTVAEESGGIEVTVPKGCMGTIEIE